jgi:methylglutaconyl-CoA hydratase
VILKAQGEFFCAGGDASSFRKANQGAQGGQAAKDNSSGAQDMARVFHEVASLPQFTIAMAQGPAMGGGVGLLSMCDMTLAVEPAWFSLSEVKLGVIPATISPYVVGKIGVANAKRLFCTAERFTAAKAKEYGLVQEVLADEPAMAAFVQKLCSEMTLCAPGAVAASKRLIEGVQGKPIDEQLIAYTAGELAKVRVTDECKEGFAALVEKRKPAWAKTPMSAKL